LENAISSELEWLKTFKNLGGLKRIMRDLLQHSDKDIRNMALELVNNFKQKTGIENVL
jgi:predicted transposase YbfD/YdcC